MKILLMKSLLPQGRNRLTPMKSASQMKLNPPTAAAISSDRREDFIIEDDFTHPQGWI
jgi:hypothetical protein